MAGVEELWHGGGAQRMEVAAVEHGSSRAWRRPERGDGDDDSQAPSGAPQRTVVAEEYRVAPSGGGGARVPRPVAGP
jgi:hypothetical protein